MPDHRAYVEPFGGASSVLFTKERSRQEVINDIFEDIVNLYRVMRDESHKLIPLIYDTPYSREEFYRAWEDDACSNVERARRTLVKSFMGRGKAHWKTGFRRSQKADKTPEKDWADYQRWIYVFSSRLRGVLIENKCAFELIDDYDSKTTCFYLDPPYLPSTRKTKNIYKHELKEEDHERLIERLRKLKANCLLSGYDSELYNSLKWHKFTKSSRTMSNKKALECLWVKP